MKPPLLPPKPETANDLMIGVKAIAIWLRLPVRQVFYMAESGQLPLFKLGAKWAGRKSTILRHFARLETERSV